MDGFSWNLIYEYLFLKTAEEIQVSLQSDMNDGTLHEDLRTFRTVFRRIILGMINASDENFRENQNKHVMFNNFSENCVSYEIMWKNMVQLGRPQMTI